MFKLLRQERHLTQRQLALQADVSSKSVYRIEQDETMPRAETVGRIARVLNVRQEKLLVVLRSRALLKKILHNADDTTKRLMHELEYVINEYLTGRLPGVLGTLLADRRLVYELCEVVVKAGPQFPAQFLTVLAERLHMLPAELALLDSEGVQSGILSGHLDALLVFVEELDYIEMFGNEAVASVDIGEGWAERLVTAANETKVRDSEAITLIVRSILRALAIHLLRGDRERIKTLVRELSLSQSQINMGITQGTIASPSKSTAIALASGSYTLSVGIASALEQATLT